MEDEEDAKANDTDDYQIQLGSAFHAIRRRVRLRAVCRRVSTNRSDLLERLVPAKVNQGANNQNFK